MKAAAWFSSLSVLGGVWVMLSPAIVGFSTTVPTHPWTIPVKISMILGGLLVILGIAGLIGFYAAGVAKIATPGVQVIGPQPTVKKSGRDGPAKNADNSTAKPAAKTSQDTDDLLNELMHRLLADNQH